MKEFYVRSFGTDPNGKSIYEWTHDKSSAALYERAQAESDCDLLNRRSPDRITPERAGDRLIFENFRIVQMGDDKFVIVFEARTDAEWLVSQGRQSRLV
jgi:hypothetical protein